MANDIGELKAPEAKVAKSNSNKVDAGSTVTKSNDKNIVEYKKEGRKISDIDRLDSLTTEAQMGTLELQILQQAAERKKIEQSLKEDEFKNRLDQAVQSITSRFKEREELYKQEIASLHQEISRLKRESEFKDLQFNKALSENNDADKNIFVTSVVGVGSNLSASVYFNDKIVTIREGMKLDSELYVKEIHSNGVTFLDKEEDIFIALTNEDYAFSKTFNKSAIELMEASVIGSQRPTSFKR